MSNASTSLTTTTSTAAAASKTKAAAKPGRNGCDSAAASVIPEKAKKVRTKSGCWTCRRRKIKCDEVHPVCNRCISSKLPCEGYSVIRPAAGSTAVHRHSQSASSNLGQHSASSSIHSLQSPRDGAPGFIAVPPSISTPASSERSSSLESRNPDRPTLRRGLSDPDPDSARINPLFSPANASFSVGYPGRAGGGGFRHVPDSTATSSSNSAVAPEEQQYQQQQHRGRSQYSLAHSYPYRQQPSSSSYQSERSASTVDADRSTTGAGDIRVASPEDSPQYLLPAPVPSFPFASSASTTPSGDTFMHSIASAANNNSNNNNSNNTISAFPPLQLPGLPGILGAPHSFNPSAHAPAPAHTPIDFDSLFGLTKNMPAPVHGTAPSGQGEPQLPSDQAGAPFPNAYWDDQDFVDRMLLNLADADPRQQQQQSQQSQHDAGPSGDVAPSGSQQEDPTLSLSRAPLEQMPAEAHRPAAPYAATTHLDEFMTGQTGPGAGNHNHPVHPPLRPSSFAHAHTLQPAVISGSADSASPRSARSGSLLADLAPQPAVDPILAASSQVELHRRLLARHAKSHSGGGGKGNKRAGSAVPPNLNLDLGVPSLEQLDLGPPPSHTGSPRDWCIPPKIAEEMKTMENQRHVELLKHYFVSTCPMFNTIDHPQNPFRTFVSEHASESLPLLHAVLAVAAINQQPLSVEARAESLLYFEAAVDLYVRSLQQQDDLSLFTLLFLSLYYAFDSGTTQSQHFSRRAQGIINERFELLGKDFIHAAPNFRFLVRLHVWYEVLANLARKPGDLRDMAPGSYTLSVLIGIIEKWDAGEEKAAGLAGVSPDYTMLGLLGIPTFFISLLNDITYLKEEQVALLQIEPEHLDEQGLGVRKAMISKHTRKIRDTESRIQFARPGRLMLPPVVASDAQIHRAVSVRFFDLFRLAASIHLLTELQAMSPNEQTIQLRVQEMVNLLGNIEQNSNYNTSGIWAFFIAGAVARNHQDRSVLHRRLDSTWNGPCGNVWGLRSVLDECWQRNAEATEAGEPIQSWKDIALARGWTLLLM